VADHKFGTFAGVFTPTVLTILGAIMYLRLGQVVGNAGLGGALLIIILAHIITISTGLAVSSIVTNTRVGAGGAFAIISQSLGLEVGGSVGIPLYLAQGVSVALYVLAFSEAWVGLFTNHPFWLIAVLTFALVFLIAYISAQFASRIQFVILAIVVFSLFSIALGSFPLNGQSGFTEAPQLWGGFSKWDFWQSFAIFFPAVTGIMVGISLSGDLREPRRSIPQGTMGAIALTFVVYLLLSYWLARVATPQNLLANSTIMADKAIFGWSVFLGMLGATFSSALGSLVAAPRVMRALAMHKIVPYSDHFVVTTPEGEPRNALISTGVITFIVLIIAIFSGGLDAVAEIITLFFLITYGMLNVVVVIEQNLGTVSFRPTLAIPRIVPLIGLVGCLFVMFLINPGFSLVAVIAVLALYTFLGRRKLANLQSDVRSGLFYSIAAWAVIRANRMPSAPERTWKPSFLVPIARTQELTGNYRFLWSMAAPQGAIHALGIHHPDKPETVAETSTITAAFGKTGIYSRSIILEENDFQNGVRTATQILQHTFSAPISSSSSCAKMGITTKSSSWWIKPPPTAWASSFSRAMKCWNWAANITSTSGSPHKARTGRTICAKATRIW
jgi:solute carrier family 12 sodium/potassium/chloride transporter 2